MWHRSMCTMQTIRLLAPAGAQDLVRKGGLLAVGWHPLADPVLRGGRTTRADCPDCRCLLGFGRLPEGLSLTEGRMDRRLAAILAIDVSGYSRLMGRDEAGTLARLKVHRAERLQPVVARYRGRIFKFTGDGALVEFGSAVDALSAAIAFQQAMAEANHDVSSEQAIIFRVGLHLGDVIVENEDLYGDGVNIAARLEGEARPGGIVASRSLHEATTGRVEATFDDLGNLALKNIERPVAAFAVRWKASDWKREVDAEPVGHTPRPLLHKPSVIVMPLRVLGSDSRTKEIADGIVEDLVSALSRFGALLVVGRNSTFAYGSEGKTARQIHEELGVQFVLEGSLRQSGDRVRLVVQLVHAESERQLWSERYDRDASDIFELQDEIARRVAAAAGTRIFAHSPARPDQNVGIELDVWLRIKRSISLCYQLTPQSLSEARTLAEEAVRLAPANSAAYEALAAVLVHQVILGSTANIPETLLASKVAADRALALNGSSEVGHWCIGMIRFFMQDHAGAIESLHVALELNPNAHVIRGTMGGFLALMGRADEALVEIQRAIELDPRDPAMSFRYINLCDAYFVKQDFESMLDSADKAIAMNVSLAGPHLRRIAALSLLSRMDEATKAVLRYESEVPIAIRQRMRSSFVRKEDRDRFRQALKDAGLAG